MRILVTYHNCLRDYRGAILLAEILRYQGHKVWIRAHWRGQIEYAKFKNVDLIVVGQIAESSTYDIAEFAKLHSIRLAINASETAVTKDNYECLFVYNNRYLNEEMIELQNIVSKDIWEYVQKTDIIKNKGKYVFLGMPRFDISIHEGFKNLEIDLFRKKYRVRGYNRVYLFISAFLFEGTFDGVTDEDAKVMGLDDHIDKQKVKLVKFKEFFENFTSYVVRENSLLLIKRHPWDCSDFFEQNCRSPHVRILDRTEYITPCIAASDVIIHEYSSTAIEAWLLKKITYSLHLGEESAHTNYNHLQHEVIVSNFSELQYQLSHEAKKSDRIKKSLKMYEPYIDGKATIRYANAINAITPHPKKARFKGEFKQKFKTYIKDILENRGFYKLSVDNIFIYSKSWDFVNWENDKARIRKLYLEPIRKYIKAHKQFIEKAR